MYGGRVIDDFDRRIVRVYMDEYMGDFLFDTFQPFHFYHDENVDYKIPIIAQQRHDFIGEFSTNLFNLPILCTVRKHSYALKPFFFSSFYSPVFQHHFSRHHIHRTMCIETKNTSILIDNRIHRLAASRQHTGSVRFASKCRN